MRKATLANTWLFASHNPGKIQEMRDLLTPYGISLVSAAERNLPEVAETGESFLENALLKARQASLSTDLPVLAEDSGLSLPSLNGAPGIYSARFAEKLAEKFAEKLAFVSQEDNRDQRNNRALLLALENQKNRRACYICVAVFLRQRHDPEPVVGQGRLCGEIVTTPRGSGGFGYDPLFYLEKYQKTVAELAAAEKARVSHRQQALQSLLAQVFAALPSHASTAHASQADD